jgi:hydrogenase nickel incorporation protein HypA/HybF
MHELSIASAIVQQVEEVVDKSLPTRVITVTLLIGALSGVEPEALEGAFPLVTEGTVMEGAKLVIERVEASARCRTCGAETIIEFPLPICSKCNGTEVDITAGREMLIKSIEVETSAFSQN